MPTPHRPRDFRTRPEAALLPGRREVVAEQSAIDTRVVPDPIGSVICGARRMLPLAASLDLWKSWGSRGRAVP